MAADTRDRSRSPQRPKKSKGGFKWKEKPRKIEDGAGEEESKRSTYRERSPNHDSRRERHRSESQERRRDRAENGRQHGDRSRGRGDGGDHIPPPRSTSPSKGAPTTSSAAIPAPAAAPAAIDPKSAAAKFGARASRIPPPSANPPSSNGVPAAPSTAPQPAPKSKASKAPPAARAPAVSAEPMMIVHVNDRLGTKAAIPCLGSDPVGAFKAMVAARIGRRPHEIMLKRQGERPFKDHITLADYGVSNGVQLDLELDTGD